MKEKPKFVLCPRCELNYMPGDDKKRKYCDICLAELNLVDPSILIPDEDAELEVLCPVCKVNYMAPDEDMCFMCAKEYAEKNPPQEDDSVDNWNSFSDAEEPLDDTMEISLSELAEEEESEEETVDGDVDPLDEDFIKDYDAALDAEADDEDEEEDYDEEIV